jgi:hypothetical protein
MWRGAEAGVILPQAKESKGPQKMEGAKKEAWEHDPAVTLISNF